MTVLSVDSGKLKNVQDLGSAEDLGKKLAKGRDAQLMGVKMVSLGEGDQYQGYEVEMKKGDNRLVTLLTVNKKKLFSVNASCSEKRWGRRENLLKGCVESFVPQL